MYLGKHIICFSEEGLVFRNSVASFQNVAGAHSYANGFFFSSSVIQFCHYVKQPRTHLNGEIPQMMVWAWNRANNIMFPLSLFIRCGYPPIFYKIVYSVISGELCTTACCRWFIIFYILSYSIKSLFFFLFLTRSVCFQYCQFSVLIRL